MTEHDTETLASPAKIGTFVCVTGPSGAGKDTLIQLARVQLGSEQGFLFPRRLVTRPISTFEDHETLSLAQFEAGVRNGLFALHWRTHGLGYAIDGAIMPAIAAGTTVVCNVSRDSIAAARKKFAHVKVVFITAPEAMIAARLGARGRDAAADLSERLLRNADYADYVMADVSILNAGLPEAAAGELARFLIAVRAAQRRDHESE
ncbi:MAG: phosphonate metabolism protein/1,5-bisphosphokinase (PRPP-forming) PhnN [Methylovirgula sp.]